MSQIIVLQNQTLLDIAVRYLGTVEAVLDLAVLNGISITQELMPGQQLRLPNLDYGCQEIVSFLNENNTQPATDLAEGNTAIIEDDFGIGSMEIETTFIVR